MAVSDLSPNDDNGFIGVGIAYWKGSSDTFWRDMGESPKFAYTPKVTTQEWLTHRQQVTVPKKTYVRAQSATVDITLQEGTGKNWALAFQSAETGPVNVTTATIITSSGSLNLSGITPISSLVPNRRYRVGAASSAGLGVNNTMVFGGGTSTGIGVLDAPATVTGTISAAGTIASLGAQSGKIFDQAQITGAIMFVGQNEDGAPVLVEFRNVIIAPNGAIDMIQGDNAMGELSLQASIYQDSGGDFGHWDWNITLPYVPYLGP